LLNFLPQYEFTRIKRAVKGGEKIRLLEKKKRGAGRLGGKGGQMDEASKSRVGSITGRLKEG